MDSPIASRVAAEFINNEFGLYGGHVDNDSWGEYKSQTRSRLLEGSRRCKVVSLLVCSQGLHILLLAGLPKAA